MAFKCLSLQEFEHTLERESILYFYQFFPLCCYHSKRSIDRLRVIQSAELLLGELDCCCRHATEAFRELVGVEVGNEVGEAVGCRYGR